MLPAGHIHPDGDSVGSCIGLWQYLRDNYPQIKADIWLEQPDNKFSIIEGYEELKQPDGQDRTYDLFISVDCAALDRLGDALPYFQKAKRTFCVDHHVSNHGFADENVILPDASSACEVLCSLMDPEKINKQAACALYMGIAHDTGVFQYSCTSPDTMRVAAMLMEKGVRIHIFWKRHTTKRPTARIRYGKSTAGDACGSWMERSLSVS